MNMCFRRVSNLLHYREYRNRNTDAYTFNGRCFKWVGQLYFLVLFYSIHFMTTSAIPSYIQGWEMMTIFLLFYQLVKRCIRSSHFSYNWNANETHDLHCFCSCSLVVARVVTSGNSLNVVEQPWKKCDLLVLLSKWGQA